VAVVSWLTLVCDLYRGVYWKVRFLSRWVLVGVDVLRGEAGPRRPLDLWWVLLGGLLAGWVVCWRRFVFAEFPGCM